MRYFVLAGGKVDAHDGRATDRIPSWSWLGAVTVLRPVRLRAHTVEAFQAILGGMAVGIPVTVANDRNRGLGGGKPGVVAAVAAAVTMYFVHIQFAYAGGNAGFDVDVVGRVVTAEVAPNLGSEGSVRDACGKAEVILVRRVLAVGVDRVHLDCHRVGRVLVQHDLAASTGRGSLALDGFDIRIVKRADIRVPAILSMVHLY